MAARYVPLGENGKKSIRRSGKRRRGKRWRVNVCLGPGSGCFVWNRWKGRGAGIKKYKYSARSRVTEDNESGPKGNGSETIWGMQEYLCAVTPFSARAVPLTTLGLLSLPSGREKSDFDFDSRKWRILHFHCSRSKGRANAERYQSLRSRHYVTPLPSRSAKNSNLVSFETKSQ